jgi:hypothetical protein
MPLVDDPSQPIPNLVLSPMSRAVPATLPIRTSVSRPLGEPPLLHKVLPRPLAAPSSTTGTVSSSLPGADENVNPRIVIEPIEPPAVLTARNGEFDGKRRASVNWASIPPSTEDRPILGGTEEEQEEEEDEETSSGGPPAASSSRLHTATGAGGAELSSAISSSSVFSPSHLPSRSSHLRASTSASFVSQGERGGNK